MVKFVLEGFYPGWGVYMVDEGLPGYKSSVSSLASILPIIVYSFCTNPALPLLSTISTAL